MNNQNEIREQITQQLVAALEAGTIPWRRPWRVNPNGAGRPRNIVSKKPYSGVNPILLAMHGMTHGCDSRWYGTFQQWKALGGSVKARPSYVKPGLWGCRIVFYKMATRSVTNQTTGEKEELTFPLLRTYTVFSADQVEGVDEFKVLEQADAGAASASPDFEAAQRLVQATEADIRHKGEQAAYCVPTPKGSWPLHLDGDFIQIPQQSKFETVGAYYESLFHELAHWGETRREIRSEKAGYAMSELVAELSSCFLSAELGVPTGEGLGNHAAYLESWLQAMKEDHRFIFRASTEASKMTDFLLSFVSAEKAGAGLESMKVTDWV